MLERFKAIPPQRRAVAAAFLIGFAVAVIVGRYGVPLEYAIAGAGALFAAGGEMDVQILDGGEE